MLFNVRRSHALLLAGGALVAATVAGCGDAQGTDAVPKAGNTAASEHGPSIHNGAGALPSAHVHGVARNPADSLVYMATHDGLFRLRPGAQPTRVGPVIDLMGFTVAGPNHFYASGHPGRGVDLPDPVGLIESKDGGQTWAALSRQGQSDFHTLTSSRAGIVGFEGEQLAVTVDGRTWQHLSPPVAPHAVAASPDGAALLVTSESGLARFSAKGSRWDRVQTPLLLQLVTWADATTVVGVAPDGRVALSTDAGATWQLQGRVGARPHALAAYRQRDESVEVLAVTAAGLVRSTDTAKTFAGYGG
jgi:DNA-binding beta-propeller fold protein YncE